jgi:ABC-type Fe3+ transport system substrate-binding protein
MMRRWVTLLALAFLGVTMEAAASELVIITPFPKELFEAYKQLFEAKHPPARVTVKQKTPQAAIAHLQANRAKPDSDIFWAGPRDAFATLKREGLLERYDLPQEIALRIPPKIGAVSIHDPDGHYFGFALSGHGLLINRRYMETHKLPVPRVWTDLTSPVYAGHLVMSAPSKSATTHLAVDMILQAYGWEKGWRTLLTAGANMGAFTNGSSGVPEAVISGQYGIGVVADLFGLSVIASDHPVEFIYPDPNSITPSSVAIIKNAPHRENAKAFVNLLLSEEGQRLLFNPEIARLPVIPKLYTQAPKNYPNPFTMKLRVVDVNTELSTIRRPIVTALFEVMLPIQFEIFKSTWSKVYKAEGAIAKAKTTGRDTAKAETKMAEVRRIIASIPMTEDQASDRFLNQIIKDNQELRRVMGVYWWEGFLNTKFGLAQSLAQEALNALEGTK